MREKVIKAVWNFPNIPRPFKIIDWKQRTVDYDGLVYDFNAKGDFLPLISLDKRGENFGKTLFNMPSYVNCVKRRAEGKEESINLLASVISSTLVGIDKSKGELDYVDMLEEFFNVKNGENMFLNFTSSHTGKSFWYETYPAMLLCILSAYYNHSWIKEKLIFEADNICKTITKLKGNFNHTAFDFITGKPYDNGCWNEPEVAAGYAYILFYVYKFTKNEKYLDFTFKCMDYLNDLTFNPLYELMLPYGVYVAAKLNAEYGKKYNINKIINWCFDGDAANRPGWGVINERWGDYDCYGLIGSKTDSNQRWDKIRGTETLKNFDVKTGGYAFAGNTFSYIAGILPAVLYDNSLACDVGKWLLNLSNAARLFYPDGLPQKNQSCAWWDGNRNNAISYEGLKKCWDTMTPYATADNMRYAWGGIDLCLYGGAHLGFLGGTINRTDDDKILAFDLSAFDISGINKVKKYLIYNPHSIKKAFVFKSKKYIAEAKNFLIAED